MLKELLDRLYRDYNVDHNTSSTIFITLFIFTVGQLLVWTARILQNHTKRKLTRMAVRRSVDSLRKAADKHRKNLSSLVSSFTLDPVNLKAFPTLATSAFNRLNETTSSAAVDAFLTGRSQLWSSKRRRIVAKTLDRVRDYSEAIKFIVDQSQSDFIRFVELGNRYNSDWNTAGEQLRQLLEKIIIIELAPNDPNKRSLEFLQTVIAESQYNWRTTRTGFSYEHFNRTMVVPLRSVCRRMDSEEAIELTIPLIKLSSVYGHIFQLHKTRRKQFQIFALNLNSHARNLRSAQSILGSVASTRRRKIRRFF